MLNRRFFRMAGVMTATTVGAGLFSLPYVFLRSGWLTGIFYLAALSAALAFVHRLYFRVLEKEGGDERLLGLALMHLGRFGRLWGLLSIQGGLILALVIYLLLARGFSEMLFPGSGNLGLALFWLAGSLPLVFGLRRLIAAEILGAVMMAGMILAVFFYGFGDRLASLPVFSWDGFFLPFGPVLFSLAGWTAVEPIFDANRSPERKRAMRAMAAGTFFAAALYALFVFGVLGSSAEIFPNALQGLADWPAWRFALLTVLGLFAIWTSYAPIGLEVANGIRTDLGWTRTASLAFVLLLPPALVALGLNDFLAVMGLAGGIFLGSEYLLLIAIAWRSLALSFREKAIGAALVALFLLGAVYEAYYFVIR